MSRCENPAIRSLSGDGQLLHPDDDADVRAWLLELVGEAPGRAAMLTYRVKHDGSWRDVETVATNLLDEPTVAGLVLNSRDVSERTALEGQLTHRALHDPLTDLANRVLFHDRVQHALARAGRDCDHTAVALLDLDNFKSSTTAWAMAPGTSCC